MVRSAEDTRRDTAAGAIVGRGRPRVLLVGKGPPDRGGIAAYIRLLLGSDLRKAWDLTFLNVAHDDARQGGRLSGANLRRTLADARAVWRASAGTDVVHIHSALAPGMTLARAGLLATAARARGARVILHAHGGQVQLWLTTAPRRAMARAALASVDTVVAVSEAGRVALASAVGDRVVRVDNGVDLNAHAVRPIARAGAPLRVLYAGLLTPRKGVLDLFQASEMLRSWGVDHELCLVGGTPDEGADAETAIRAAAAAHGIELLGSVTPEEMPAMYAHADVFCLPSWWEAMPLSLLEAMASGLPVVVTAVGDVPRVVEDGTSGLLVPPRHPASLAAALACVLLDRELRQRLGQAARARVESHYSAAGTIAAVDHIYDSLCREHR
jgi:glycosyltransferase involved in cell wall biosynthesis